MTFVRFPAARNFPGSREPKQPGTGSPRKHRVCLRLSENHDVAIIAKCLLAGAQEKNMP